ncbi:hypothetical protein BX666DRAFT_1470735 [Dichotomocladium elegans]|nr:hypothetical protein BX666DRAFT_1470735 [Dichotomocladium elegans]
MIKSTSLKLFLYGNALSRLSPCLFVLKNLSVLSLRHNQLTEIPPEIGLLQNLVEISVGNNQLEYLPSELVELPRLTTLCISPNPFRRSQSLEGRARDVIASIPSLVEITSRQLLAIHTPTSDILRCMPYDLQDRLRSVSPMNICYTCRQRFYIPSAQEMVWREVFGVHNVPILYRFCSRKCCDARQ